MADNMEDDLKKMKVPELKQALKDKGLSTAGTKPDLIKRLLVESVGSVDPVLDEDEILKDDPAPSVVTAPPKSQEQLPTEKPNNETNGVPASTDQTPDTQTPEGTTTIAKPVEVQKLTEAERLKMRADKFGITSEQSKKEQRAQRFGISMSENKSSNISSSDVPVDAEKLKKRAERFGLSAASQTSEDERKRKRAERFGTSLTTPTSTVKTSTGISLNSTDSELEAKKRKRAERFGLT